jgi:hypothetical protein
MTTRTLAIISVSAAIAISIIIGAGSGSRAFFQPVSLGEGYLVCPSESISEEMQATCTRAAVSLGVRDGAIALLLGGAIVLVALRRRSG